MFLQRNCTLHNAIQSRQAGVGPVAGVGVDINPRPAAGGVWTPPPPLRFFEDSENTAELRAAGFSPTVPHIFSATFVKISTQGHVRSGHQVRSNDATTK